MTNHIKAFALCAIGAYCGAIFGTTFAYMKEEERRAAAREHLANGGKVTLTPKGREVAQAILKAQGAQKGSGSATV